MAPPIVYVDVSAIREGKHEELEGAMNNLLRFVEARWGITGRWRELPATSGRMSAGCEVVSIENRRETPCSCFASTVGRSSHLIASGRQCEGSVECGLWMRHAPPELATTSASSPITSPLGPYSHHSSRLETKPSVKLSSP